MHMKSEFYPHDPLKLEQSLTHTELDLMHMVRDFAQTKLKPLVTDGFWLQNQAVNAYKLMGSLNLLTGDIAHRFGGAKINAVGYGLIARELEKIDSSFRTVFSITASLVATAIDSFGTKAQQDKYLPLLNSGKLLGCFALTEPNHGSDPSSMETSAQKVTGGYKISGEKRWIGLAPYADIFITWAKDEAGQIRGFILDKAMSGIDVVMIEGKISLRIAPQGHIKLKDVFVPEENILSLAIGINAPFTCLNHARYGISWGALGAAEECLNISLNYARNRIQFGTPIASKQLVQKKLVDMQVEIALGLMGCLQVGRLIEKNEGSFLMINLLKYNSAAKALNIARNARDILGGNGILEEYGIMRHLVNLETVNTYEGTTDIHALTLGRALTGLSAF